MKARGLKPGHNLQLISFAGELENLSELAMLGKGLKGVAGGNRDCRGRLGWGCLLSPE